MGTLVNTLVDFAVPAGPLDNVTDVDAGALLGIAVTAADTTNGSWFYSLNGGGAWTALGAVTNASARVLAADADNRLYFQPAANFNGTLATAITFRAWDRSSGADGSLVDTSVNGGTTALSTATDTASLVVNPVNDAPVAGADSFDTIGNTELRVDIAAGQHADRRETTGPGTGARANDSDPVENDPFTVTSIVGCADVSAPFDCTASGERVDEHQRHFSYIPSPALATGAPTTPRSSTSSPTSPRWAWASPATGTGTVTIHVYDKVWYVRQGAAGTAHRRARSARSRASPSATDRTATHPATTSSSTTPALPSRAPSCSRRASISWARASACRSPGASTATPHR